jgi:hypothetical protein
MRLLISIIWLLGSSTFLYAGNNKDAACQSFVFTGELAAKASFERTIGNGLNFQLKPTRLGAKGELDGWEIYIVRPEAAEQDYIYPVNIPLRFNGVQILGASYNDDAKTSLGHPHEMWFLLSKADYDKLWPAVEHALWPYSAPHPDKTTDEFFEALKAVSTGWLKMSVLSYDIAPDADSVRRIKFQPNLPFPLILRLRLR